MKLPRGAAWRRLLPSRCLGLTLAAAVAGCSAEAPVGLDETDVSLYALVTTVDGISLAPPLGPEITPAGTFDPSLRARLTVLLETTDGAGRVATAGTFSATTQPALHLLAPHELYFVGVPATAYFTDPALAYRFRVLLDGREIARSDMTSRVFDVMTRFPNLLVGVKVRAELRPAPAVTALEPASVLAGASNFVLTVHGARFSSDSTVQLGSDALVTTYVSPAELTATVPATLVTAGGLRTVTVTTPNPGGGSTTASFTVNNPTPILTALTPSSAVIGSGATIVTLDGDGFLPGAIVGVGGAELPSTLLSSTRLTTSIPAERLRTSATLAVTVSSPAPTVGTSAPSYFAVREACDGVLDPGCACLSGATRSCYAGPAGTAGVGACQAGFETCSSGQWGACLGEVRPSAERCDGRDDDCNGQVDDGNPQGGAACGTGQPGVCAAGTSLCSGGVLVCAPSRQPSVELCNGLDDDCDGQVDEGACVTASCTDGQQNGMETDVDCGGACTPCGERGGCLTGADCRDHVCTNGRCQGASCADQTRNGAETDVDCGGLCTPCASNRSCAQASDCASGVCRNGVCAAPSCTDGVLNGTESDRDCGGSCGACASGRTCASGSDCTSLVCRQNVCIAATCLDGVSNQTETDVDCGGRECLTCAAGRRCGAGSDCESGLCAGGTCRPPSCSDGMQNGSELGVDCGGPCRPCVTLSCGADAFCGSDNVALAQLGGVASTTDFYAPNLVSTVNDGQSGDTRNGWGNNKLPNSSVMLRFAQTYPIHAMRLFWGGDNTGGWQSGRWLPRQFYVQYTTSAAALVTDLPSSPLWTTFTAQTHHLTSSAGYVAGRTVVTGFTATSWGTTEALTFVPVEARAVRIIFDAYGLNNDWWQGLLGEWGVYAAYTCHDGVQDGAEPAVDCGGGECVPCSIGQACSAGRDCATGSCVGGLCQAATCGDGVQNGSETGVDCGGACSACGAGAGCLVGADCASGFCSGNLCAAPSCTDGVRNGAETDVDCGGTCGACPEGRRCTAARDCASGVCTNGTCSASCTDGVQNGGETGVDCGGSCLACVRRGCASSEAGCAELSVGLQSAGGLATASDTFSVNPVTTINDGVASRSANGWGNNQLASSRLMLRFARERALFRLDVFWGGDNTGGWRPDSAYFLPTQYQVQVTTDLAASVTDPPSSTRWTTLTTAANNLTASYGTISDGHIYPAFTDAHGWATTQTLVFDRLRAIAVRIVFEGLSVGGTQWIGLVGEVDARAVSLQSTACLFHSECSSGVCTSGRCGTPTCSDLVSDGTETGLDCGGGSCPACATGQGCRAATDCASGVCTNLLCQAPSCTDGVRNGAEVDVDCGGTCGACGTGRVCRVSSDCASLVCSGGVCQAPSCTDGIRNGTESDVDCGGSCAACPVGRACTSGSDCASSSCAGGVCQAPTCSDGIRNGTEAAIDCGGSCAPCLIIGCQAGETGCAESVVGTAALGGVASASDTYLPQNPVSQINDGVASATAPGWGNNNLTGSRVMIMLPASTTVTRLRLYWGGNGWSPGTNTYLPRQFLVQVSTLASAAATDAVGSASWVTLTSADGLSASAPSTVSTDHVISNFTNASWGTTQVVSFYRRPVRAIRLVFDAASYGGTNWIGTLGELGVVSVNR